MEWKELRAGQPVMMLLLDVESTVQAAVDEMRSRQTPEERAQPASPWVTFGADQMTFVYAPVPGE